MTVGVIVIAVIAFVAMVLANAVWDLIKAVFR
jgi:hypothetical protein